MKNKNRTWVLPLILLEILFLVTISCKKETITTKKDPIVTWSNPADISFGTLLSSKQLNATADQPGTFVYTPPIGTKLNVGANQNLKVDFTPTNTDIYNSVIKTVKINVIDSTLVIDADGNIYHTVTIGSQTWMKENLKTTKYNDGTRISYVTSTEEWYYDITYPAYCWYEIDPDSYKDTYGALYNWGAVISGKLAPKGWHVPTDSEWTILENYLIANGYNYDGTVTGDRDSNNKIAKALASNTTWVASSDTGVIGNSDYPAKRNATNFTAMPGGYRYYDGIFDGIGKSGLWWTSTEKDTRFAWMRFLYYDYSDVYRGDQYKSCGLSVRCVKD